ncbi:hypothetical protein [Streptomyces odonnellii]|uniref:hypothetical protein n=1 Tax=Streptomyces odonnellii TaxID=1417980 RepID=UPI000625040E
MRETGADLLTTAVGMVPLILVGLTVGWRIDGSVPGACGAFGLLLLFLFVPLAVRRYGGSREREAVGPGTDRGERAPVRGPIRAPMHGP